MIAAYQKDTVTWRRATTLDQWGTMPTRNDEQLTVRVNWKAKMIRDMQGREVVATGSLYMTNSPDKADTFTIAGRDFVILSVEERKSFSRKIYYEVFIA
jgi:hypothetical protein